MLGTGYPQNEADEQPQHLTTLSSSHQAIEIANRYFTSKRLASPEEQINIPTHIDPKGILQSIKGDTLFHTAENQVEYYQRVTSNSGEHRFVTTNPAKINEGDIVEIQFTIVLVESTVTRHADTKLVFTTKPILRSITLLDGTYSEAYRKLAFNQQRKPCLKRKVGHSEEESTEAQERLKRMAIDSNK
ncbi:hypothetical protein VNI00_017677 [Paramarasmius palmivorus]|uniref:Uncharacterized protein n=1 Tax=Paramarasmius palmivorus TaxID=297713 RepID=A0AAW0B5L1_9AGAR